MKLIKIIPSQREGKRFVAIFDEPKKTIHFGYSKGSTYIDHHDKIKRENYIKRHAVRENWDEVNAGSLSRFLLWGDSKSMNKNLKEYIKKFNL